MGLTPRHRPAWFAVTAFVAVFGVGEFARWVFVDPAGGPGWWGIDLKLVIDAGGRFATGQPIYSDPKFLYPPLAAIVAAAVAIPRSLAMLRMGAAAIAADPLGEGTGQRLDGGVVAGA